MKGFLKGIKGGIVDYPSEPDSQEVLLLPAHEVCAMPVPLISTRAALLHLRTV